MGKRGASEADWIISLSIFLLYIGWFFAFVLPQISIVSGKDASMSSLQESFLDMSRWRMHKFPIIVFSNDTGSYIPIIADYNMNTTDIKIADGRSFALWNGRLLFLANITSSPAVFYILEGGAFTGASQSEGLNIIEDYVSTTGMSVYFTGSLLDKVRYEGDDRIEDTTYAINGQAVASANHSYEDLGFAGIFEYKTGSVNITSFVFQHNPTVYMHLAMEDQTNYTLGLEMDLARYTAYFSDNSKFGNFAYQNQTHSNAYSHDYVTLYGKDALSIYFNGSADLNFTDYNRTLKFAATLPIHNDYWIRLSFHDGDYRNRTLFDSNCEYGAVADLEGIRIENLSVSYEDLMAEWGYKKEFYVAVYENTTSMSYIYNPRYEIGEFDPTDKIVYAETIDYQALTPEGELTPASVNFRIW